MRNFMVERQSHHQQHEGYIECRLHAPSIQLFGVKMKTVVAKWGWGNYHCPRQRQPRTGQARRPVLQPWRFIPLKIGIVSAEEQGLQTVSVRQNRAGYVSIAQLTKHSSEHLVLLRPGRLGLLLHTLFYSDESGRSTKFRTDTEWVASQELELAHLLVESLAAHFEPAKYKDSYRENLRALLDAKIRGEELKLGAPNRCQPQCPISWKRSRPAWSGRRNPLWSPNSHHSRPRPPSAPGSDRRYS
jgi:hypothetical protein